MFDSSLAPWLSTGSATEQGLSAGLLIRAFQPAVLSRRGDSMGGRGGAALGVGSRVRGQCHHEASGEDS